MFYIIEKSSGRVGFNGSTISWALRNPYIPGIKPTWSWCMIFLIYCWILSNLSIIREINPEYSLEGLMLKLKLQYFRPSDVNSWLIGKFPDAEKDWGQKEKRASEDEITGWHHWCNGHALGQTLGDGEKQRGLVCCTMGFMGSQRVGQNRATEK